MINNVSTLKSIVLNFGPQHPAAHGVLRLLLQLRGEVVEKLDPHIGFLHRGTEKLLEYSLLVNATPFFDRLDYTSVIIQSHGYCLTVEGLLFNNKPFITTLYLRTLFDELARILNHLLAIATHSLDIGSMSPAFWAFEERELIMELWEFVSGARMHVALYNINFFSINFITKLFFFKLFYFIRNSVKTFTEVYSLLTCSNTWRLRLVNVGVLSYKDCIFTGITGPLLRSVGFCSDLRLLLNSNYGAYWQLQFKSFVGIFGDSFDRFLLRVRELFESIHIIIQCVSNLYPLVNNFYNVNKSSIELTISKFKTLNFYKEVCGINYSAVEASKGYFGVGLLINNGIIYRARLRSPAFFNLQSLLLLGQGHLLADIVTLIGSIDVVFGEVDR